MCANSVRQKVKGFLMCNRHKWVPASQVVINGPTGAFISAKTGDCPNGKFVVGEDVVTEGAKK